MPQLPWHIKLVQILPGELVGTVVLQSQNARRHPEELNHLLPVTSTGVRFSGYLCQCMHDHLLFIDFHFSMISVLGIVSFH